MYESRLARTFVDDIEVKAHQRRGYVDVSVRRGLSLPAGFRIVEMVSEPVNNRLVVVFHHASLNEVPEGGYFPTWPFVNVDALKHLRVCESRLDC